MRILHIINSLGGGGRERRMSQVVASLSRTVGCEQAVITLVNSGSYKVFDTLNIPIHTVEGSRLARFKEYKKILKSFQPEVVHLWLETPSELFYFSLCKYFYHYKLIAGFVADGNPVHGLNTYALGIRCAFLMSDCIISNSRAGLIAKNAPMKKSEVIYNGFDFVRFKTSFNREIKRKELDISQSWVVAMSASMKPTKDWKSFVLSALECQKKGFDINFLAIGGGELLEPMKEFALSENINNIKFLGYREDVEEILQASDFFMLFTNNEKHAEGVSNAILEAMAAGLPVIATQGGGTSEIVEDGVNGFVIEPRDYKKGAEIIALLLKDEYLITKIGESAKKTVKAKFSIDGQNSRYITLYERLLS